MKRIFLACFSAITLAASAQSVDPVVMTINGKPVTRGEFEYAYNKNASVEGAVEKKTVEEYAQMFVNYKLKVAAAEAARMDTLSSFQKEFRQYRDLQLTPYMVDEVFIDSVARSMYQRTSDQLAGKDMLRPAHILILVKQNASEAEKKQAEAKADSLYKVLQAGGDFASLAKAYSADKGSAVRGGELPWIGPGMTLVEFENEAYKLQTGEMSKPFATTVGYHIVKMLERKSLAPYAEMKAEIYDNLKRQGIEEISAEKKIKKLIEASNGTLTREMVMDSLIQANIGQNPELKYLIQEYYDGLLLYEVSKGQVWDKAAEDEKGLEQWYKQNKAKYAWEEPRFKGFVIYAKDKKSLKKAVKIVKKNQDGEWKSLVKKELNKDSVVVRVVGPLLCKKGENNRVDELVFGAEKTAVNKAYPMMDKVGKKLKQPQSYKDVKSLVLTDYQESLEKVWVEKLRKQFTFDINQSVLSTVNNH